MLLSTLKHDTGVMAKVGNSTQSVVSEKGKDVN
jgi:hypothetical protein